MKKVILLFVAVAVFISLVAWQLVVLSQLVGILMERFGIGGEGFMVGAVVVVTLIVLLYFLKKVR